MEEPNPVPNANQFVSVVKFVYATAFEALEDGDDERARKFLFALLKHPKTPYPFRAASNLLLATIDEANSGTLIREALRVVEVSEDILRQEKVEAKGPWTLMQAFKDWAKELSDIDKDLEPAKEVSAGSGSQKDFTEELKNKPNDTDQQQAFKRFENTAIEESVSLTLPSVATDAPSLAGIANTARLDAGLRSKGKGMAQFLERKAFTATGAK
ncbi:MAG: hypothetical protein M1831_004234 [Alyxoria varia]|nr:MAG: hypothetical protein M1831_004234 [Alyxoria varia]